MKCVFAVSSGYDETDLLLLNRLFGKRNKNQRAVDVILRCVKITVAAVLLYAGLFGVSKGNVSTLMRVLFIAVGAVELVSGVMHDRVRAARAKRMMRRQMASVTFTLDEDGITEKTDTRENTAAYGSVDAVYYWKERWFLFLADGHAVLLPKRCMQGAGEAEFSEFLENKTGKMIETIEK